VTEIYRTEIRASENSEQLEDRPKFVVIVEISEKAVASAVNLSSAQLRTKGYEIALMLPEPSDSTIQAFNLLADQVRS
jgi:hypothetical protein